MELAESDRARGWKIHVRAFRDVEKESDGRKIEV